MCTCVCVCSFTCWKVLGCVFIHVCAYAYVYMYVWQIYARMSMCLSAGLFMYQLARVYVCPSVLPCIEQPPVSDVRELHFVFPFYGSCKACETAPQYVRVSRSSHYRDSLVITSFVNFQNVSCCGEGGGSYLLMGIDDKKFKPI